MGNLNREVASGAASLGLLFGGLTATPNPQYQKRKRDLCGFHRPINFTRLVSEMGLFPKVWKGS